MRNSIFGVPNFGLSFVDVRKNKDRLGCCLLISQYLKKPSASSALLREKK